MTPSGEWKGASSFNSNIKTLHIKKSPMKTQSAGFVCAPSCSASPQLLVCGPVTAVPAASGPPTPLHEIASSWGTASFMGCPGLMPALSSRCHLFTIHNPQAARREPTMSLGFLWVDRAQLRPRGKMVAGFLAGLGWAARKRPGLSRLPSPRAASPQASSGTAVQGPSYCLAHRGSEGKCYKRQEVLTLAL